MNQEKKILLQKLPKVDRIFTDPAIQGLCQQFPKQLVLAEIREYLEELRKKIVSTDGNECSFTYESICDDLHRRAELRLCSSMQRAVNGVGIVLHTGLGRAPLSEKATAALIECVTNYCSLEIDRETGRRGDRYSHVEKLICQLTGAEAALVVNNNCAATLLVLNTIAKNKEVIVSRGELIEIGGSFRIPDVMKQSGAKLVEIGTTNRTHLKDYTSAINPDQTGMILRVHQSNYAIIGFTAKPTLHELCDCAHQHGLPLFDDIGSGALIDYSRWGLPYEPTVQESLKAGSDIICFSGDKLLGGPQCGIILGKKVFIDAMKKNQLTRAFRCDKMTFAVLEATLRLFLDEKQLVQHHPVLRMMCETSENVKKRCMLLKKKIKAEYGEAIQIHVVEQASGIGSGSMALHSLKTWALDISKEGMTADEIAFVLRNANPPVFSRVNEGKLLLDCRTIRSDELAFVVNALRNV